MCNSVLKICIFSCQTGALVLYVYSVSLPLPAFLLLPPSLVLMDGSINEPNRWINQSIKQSNNQSINQSINGSIDGCTPQGPLANFGIRHAVACAKVVPPHGPQSFVLAGSGAAGLNAKNPAQGFQDLVYSRPWAARGCVSAANAR